MAWSKNTTVDIRKYDAAYRQKNRERINQQDREYFKRREIKPLPFDIRGQKPGKNEKAIYFLRFIGGKAFYVGVLVDQYSDLSSIIRFGATKLR